jgi:hydrogenase-1 operon protein HyaF
MKSFPIPLRSIGPGSQPAEDDTLAVLDMPRDVTTFQMPRVPERVDPQALAAARDLLQQWHAALGLWDPAAQPHGPQLELTGTAPAALAIVNDVLGEGEVVIRIAGDCEWRIQESVFPGFWRCVQLDAAGQVLRDWLEAGPVPGVAGERAHAAGGEAPWAVDLPPGAMNSPALLAEIGSRRAAVRPGDPAGVINLTLLPMSPDDHAVLEQALPVGPVVMISRGFGNCHVSSTLVRGVWRVQYFNSARTLILNTIEIVDMPEAAVAAAEDLVESRERLDELLQWMDESIDEAS